MTANLQIINTTETGEKVMEKRYGFSELLALLGDYQEHLIKKHAPPPKPEKPAVPLVSVALFKNGKPWSPK